MRWNDLFGDLEAQWAGLELAERSGEVAERTRIETVAIGLGARLHAATGAALRIRLPAEQALTGTLVRTGPDWLLLDEGGGREALVALPAVLAVSGLGRLATVPGSEGRVLARLTMRHALRGIARDRSAVRLHLCDATVLDATLDRVGADFVDVALHAPGEARRRREVREVQAVPFTAVAAVRRSGVAER
jgi:hypothetical protein